MVNKYSAKKDYMGDIDTLNDPYSENIGGSVVNPI